MTDFHLYHFIWLLVVSFGIWAIPTRYQVDGIALATGLFLAIFSPISALLLLSSSLVVFALAVAKAWSPFRALWAGTLYCLLQLVLIRGLQQFDFNIMGQALVVIGLGYYTCRHIHYLIEVYMGNIKPDLRLFLRYQFFLPVMLAGPIHRYSNFMRQCARRRFDEVQISEALERVLYGYVKIVVLGNHFVAFLLGKKLGDFNAAHQGPGIDISGLMGIWLDSAQGWLYMYLQFSGWTDVAIGFALLMGFRVEENFNKPWLAKSLVDFWQRWHMTLSFWCRDYIFTPLMAATRRPLLSIGVAMIAMGLWHEFTLFYVLWGIYQALGIVIAHQFNQYSGNFDSLKILKGYRAWQPVAWFLTINFLILGNPIIRSVETWLRGIA
jgi:D-alanyl-lipoteichoic acid acyltransferase DltB (MBOAT superfamily)